MNRICLLFASREVVRGIQSFDLSAQDESKEINESVLDVSKEPVVVEFPLWSELNRVDKSVRAGST